MEASQSNGQQCQKIFRRIYPRGRLERNNLMGSPMPENVDTVKKLKDFLKDLLKEKKKTNEQNLENVFE